MGLRLLSRRSSRNERDLAVTRPSIGIPLRVAAQKWMTPLHGCVSLRCRDAACINSMVSWRITDETSPGPPAVAPESAEDPGRVPNHHRATYRGRRTLLRPLAGQ